MKELLDRLIHQVTADKKKLSVMLCALAIGLLLWGRLILQGVPRTATADDKPETAQATDKPDSTVTTGAQTRKPVQTVHIDLPASPGRDLFGIDPSRYRRNPEARPDKTVPKSAQVTPDEDPQIAAVRYEAMELRLESVVTGTQARAYINGVLLAPGEEIQGFELLEVTDRHVLLTKYGLIIKLRM